MKPPASIAAWNRLASARDYALAIVLVLLVLAVRWVFGSRLDHPTLILLAAPVLAAAYVGGLGPGLVATFTASLGTSFLLLVPVGNFRVASSGERIQLLIFIAVGVLISATCEALRRARFRAEAARLAAHSGQTATSQLASIVESANVAIIGKDLHGVVTSWNAGAERIFGYTREQMVGRSILQLVPDDLLEEEQKILAAIAAGEGVQNLETVRRTQDGRLIEVSVTSSPIRDAAGQIIGASKIVRDISTGKAQQLELARMSRLYAALSQINRAIIWEVRREELFATICRVLAEFGGFRMVWIGSLDPATQQVRVAARHGDDGGYLAGLVIHLDGHAEDQGPAATSMRDGRPFVCNDLPNDDGNAPWRDLILRLGFRSFAALPIRQGGVVCGSLSVYSDELDFFQDKEIGLLDEAAVNVSFALDNLERDARRTAAEQAVRTKERQLRMVTDTARVGLAIVDRQRRYTFANATYFEMLDLPRDPSDSHRLREASSSLEYQIQQLLDVAFAGERGSHELSRPEAGGLRHYVVNNEPTLEEGVVTQVVVMVTDITARKLSELELQENAARLRSILDTMFIFVVLVSLDGELVEVNQASLAIAGLSRQDVLGRNLADTYWFSHSQTAQQQVGAALALAARGQIARDDFVVRIAGGKLITIDATYCPLLDASGKVLQIVGSAVDVTQRKRAEETLGRMNIELEHRVAERTAQWETANRELEAFSDSVSRDLRVARAADHLKSAFLATMSHELRTPLNSIIGFSGILLQGLAGPLNVEQTKQLGMVKGSANHLLELINDVLDLSKIEAGQLEVQYEQFDLRTLLERVTAVLKPMADQKHLELRLEIATGVSQMVSDRRRVEQILINLLSNAIKFTRQGSVTLSADLRGDDAALFRVVDTGIGIKASDLSSLFQAFRQIDSGINRASEGTGLGLAISRRLAGLLGGELTATSTWGQGSEFTLSLPLRRSKES